MRICIDARSLLEKKPSGISLYSVHLIESLLKEFPQDSFVLFTNSFSGQNALDRFRHYSHCRIHSTRIPNKLLHAAYSVFRFPSLEKMTGRCDVFFFPNVMFLPRLPRASVLTVHDISYVQLPRVYSLRNHLWYRLVRARTLIQEAAHIVTDSQGTQVALDQEFPGIKDRVSVVHPALMVPPKGVQRKKPEYLVVLGDIDERKNVYGILSAYERVRKADSEYPQLVFVGKRGYVNLRPATLAIFNRLKKCGWIKECGYVSESEKWEIVSRARALLFVSFYEGFGFPGLEAESLGIPVIASNRTCIPEIFGRGPIYVNPDNINSIVHALRMVKDFPQRMQYDNPLLARTWKGVAHDMMSIFKNIAYENRN